MAVTSKQIAELAGVSRGTVDRALHNRGRVNPEVAKRIRQIADELGYHPHPAAQALVMANKEFKLGVYQQSLNTPTMQMIYAGLQRAASELKQYGVTTIFKTNPDINKRMTIKALDELVAEGCHGLAITPVNEPDVIERVNQLTDSGIPVIAFNGDIPESKRLCYVGMDNYRGGRMAGAIMGYMLPNGGKVLPLTAHLTYFAHYIRAKGFMEVIESDFPNIELLPLQGCFDNDSYAYEITKMALQQHPDLAGLYAASHGGHGACRAIDEAGLSGKVRVIGFDMNPANIEDLRAGRSTVVFDQQADLEGYRPLHILYDYLARGIQPSSSNEYTALNIFTKYNID